MYENDLTGRDKFFTLNLMKFWGLLIFLGGFFFSGLATAHDRVASVILADTNSGYMFLRENEKKLMPPASLAKLMTLYLTFSAIEQGWLKWEDQLTTSEYAASQPASHLKLLPGQKISVREAVMALIVKSANDAAVVLAETLAGNEANFSRLMNDTATQLHMKRTFFTNASGLHNEQQQTTAQDMAILSLALINHFPNFYPLFSEQSFEFNGQTYVGHNHVLQEYEGAEGLKTGYVAAVGYNLISTAKKDDARVLGIVMGADSIPERDEAMKNLLDEGFRRISVQKKAVAEGRLDPAFDPLHRRMLLNKADVSAYGTEIKYYIRTALLPAKKQPAPVFVESSPELWSVQVGAFSSLEKAKQMAIRALALLENHQQKIYTPSSRLIYRAQLTGFKNYQSAYRACQELTQKNCPCFLVQNKA